MADFRKWFIVLAMLTLFTGVAAAQIPFSAFTCTAVAQVVPTIRAEGLTELVGDIVLSCNGGNPIAPGGQIPQANIIVTLSAPVTSRLATTTQNFTTSPNGLPSEALLLIDEPGAPIPAVVPGFGPGAPINVCTSLTGGCIEFASSATGSLGSTVVPTTTPNGDTTAGSAVKGWNTFQGVVPIQGSSQVIFAGVPILPPATSGQSRVYRITNIRVNVNGNTGASTLAGLLPIQANISTSGVTSLPVVNNVLTVAYAQSSLLTTATSPNNVFTQCNPTQAIDAAIASTSPGPLNVALLNFTERFPSAFKTKVAPLTTDAGAAFLATNVGGATAQNIPGQLYNSESGLIIPVPGGPGAMTGAATPGLASFGTRFKAVFTNLPAGVTIWVSRYNVNTTAVGGGGGFLPAAAQNTPPVSTATNAFARYTTSETGAFADPGGSSLANAYGAGGVQVVNIGSTTTSANSLTAVWEVTNANLAANETFSFAVFMTFAPTGTPVSTPTITPATNGPAVTLSYAPTPGTDATATAWALPQTSSTPIPRFGRVTTVTAQPIVTIVACQTVLLFPYVTSAANMNTGIAISNTGLDPMTPTTVSSQGFCRLFFYGHNASGTLIKPGTTQPTVPSSATFPNGLAAGDTTAFTIYDVFGANLSGYLFAACDFQYAHGFAYISDFNNNQLAMGYLALIVNDSNKLLGRPGSQAGESLNQ